MDKQYHLITIYFCIVILAVLVLFVAHKSLDDDALDGNWVCAEVVCAQRVNVNEWMDQNCAGELTNAICKLSVNGVTQEIPLAEINLTYLGEQCQTYICTQEAYVRQSNYTFEYNTSSLVLT